MRLRERILQLKEKQERERVEAERRAAAEKVCHLEYAMMRLIRV